MDSDLLKIITQIETLITEAKGLNRNVVPDGVNPAPDGSTFDTNSLPPLLSVNEKSRVREVAKIFRDILTPGPEARRAEARQPTRDENIAQNIIIARDNEQTGAKGKGGGLFGIISSLTGGIGGAGSALPIAASALPVLAALGGIALITLAGGKAAQWIVEGLKAANGIDWDGVGNLAKIITGVLRDIVDIAKDWIGFLLKTGGKIVSGLFEMWRENVSFLVDIIGQFGETIKKYRDVQWDDLNKAGAAIIGFVGAIAIMGFPPLAIIEALGNVIFTWTNLNIAAFSKNLIALSMGLDRVHETIKGFDDVDFVEFAKVLVTSFTLIGGLAGISLLAPLTALGTFTATVASMGLDAIANSFVNLSMGIDKLGQAGESFALGMSKLEDVDAGKLFELSGSISALGASLAAFSVGTGLASFFSSDALKEFIAFSENYYKLFNAAAGVERVSAAFKTWSNLRLDNLQWNLKSIQETIEKLDVKKLERAFKTPISFKLQDEYTKAVYMYITTGKDNHDMGGGLVSLTKEILAENRKLNTNVSTIKDIILRMENKPEAQRANINPQYQIPQEGRRTTTTNPRDSIRPLGL